MLRADVESATYLYIYAIVLSPAFHHPDYLLDLWVGSVSQQLYYFCQQLPTVIMETEISGT